jgi:endogenous inhibitor of DNA gyrase (YacG/DUF329 family)
MAGEKKVGTRCPHCKEKIHWEGNQYRPFCSQKCKLIDLGMWIEEEYRITVTKQTNEEKGEGRGGMV